MSQALYSKYRPKVFEDVVGQQHILTTIKNAILQDKISHAYLFCGPRGTGKTTMARLLAKACICKNTSDSKTPSTQFCGSCEDCMDIANGSHADVYELDAASRTGVENVREEIISRVGFAATSGAKKIYIIDEVHMLSTAAFNALLKTLEEPPPHVIFILCTTDPQKIPETVISRCQRYDFSVLSTDDITTYLDYICIKENVNAQTEALQQIAKQSNGGMRNAITQLEQLIAFSSGNITISTLAEEANSNNYDFASLLHCLSNNSLKDLFDWTSKANKCGFDFVDISSSFAQLIRDLYVIKAGGEIDRILDNNLMQPLENFSLDELNRILMIVLSLLEELKTSNNAQLSFELFMAKITNPTSDYTLEGLAQRISNLENMKSDGSFAHIKNDVSSINNDSKETENLIEQSDETTQKNVDFANVVPNQKFDVDIDDSLQPKLENVLKDEDKSANEGVKSQQNFNNSHVFNIDDIEKLWHKVYAEIRNSSPAFAATLVTAHPTFNEQSNQLVLQFPESASFNVSVLKKPENISKVHDVIKRIMGEEIGFNIEISKDIDDDFEPKFENNFRQEQKNETDDNTSMTDILSNFGAYNITEE